MNVKRADIVRHLHGRAIQLLASLFAAAALGSAVVACGGAETASPASPPTPSAGNQPATETQQTEAEPPAPAEAAPSEPGFELPKVVADTRNAILEAARARDYAALRVLLDPATFSYSFGESGDPIAYWRELEDVGEVPILGDFLPLVLSWPYAKDGNVYVWPSVHTRSPSEWTEQDFDVLRQLYSDDDIAGFEQAGAYLGYRVGIRDDGTWIYFVAGD